MRTLNYCCKQSVTRINRSPRLVFTVTDRGQHRSGNWLFLSGATDTCPSTRNIPDCTDCVRHSQALLILLFVPDHNLDFVFKSCLEKTCGATVTTNPDMTAVISCKPQHSGHHPVTMRSIASHKAGCTTPSAAAVVEIKTNLASTMPPSRTTASPPDIQDTAQNSIIKTPDILTHSTPNISIKNNGSINIDELELENSSLKNTITDLKKQLRDVTDHVIASDTRLLQYTNEVFELPHGFAGNICPSITTGVVDQQLGARFEDNEADEDSARIHEPSTRVAGSPGTATAAVSAGNETIPVKHSSQSLENLLKLERDKN
ncbi:hypothetical protein J6590_015877 [Homalodisca vitripennis]|nr:hypothetical protein J6590_015877 [Homalodisca vitripennis]